MEKLLGEIMQCLDALLRIERTSLLYYASMWMHQIHVKIKQIADIAGTAETITRSCCLCHFPFAAKSDSEWDWHEFAITHSLLFKIYFSVCVCQALGTTLISNRKVEQTERAFPQIDRDQSLHFDWMTKQKQQLKVCLMPIASGQLPKPKYQGT